MINRASRTRSLPGRQSRTHGTGGPLLRASPAHFPSLTSLASQVSGGGGLLNREQDGRRRRGGRAPVDRGGGVHDWGNRDGVAAALIHPHALAPLLHRRARPAVVALPHPPPASGGVLHVVSTALLGIAAVTMANTIAGEETVHKLASLLLIFLGGGYIVLFAMGKGGHSHAHNHPMEKMAVAGLVLVPALSPCATTLPVFLAVGNSSSMMILAIIVLLFSTITVMTSLVSLLFYGASQIKFHWVERYDKILVGMVLCFVGVLTYVLHHHDGDEHSLHAHVHRKLVYP